MLYIICWPSCGFIDRTASEITGDRVREKRGATHSKGPQARTRTRSHCSEDMGHLLHQLSYWAPRVPPSFTATCAKKIWQHAVTVIMHFTTVFKSVSVEYDTQNKGRAEPLPVSSLLLLPFFLSFLPSLPPQCLLTPSMGSEENDTILFLLIIIKTLWAGCPSCR